MKNQPLISIIVAVYNRAEVLQRCINSVTSQGYPHKELIIIDGGSTDGTVDILKSNSEKISYWESQPDRGIYHAFNKGLNYAKGDWIYFLGSDDYFWSNQALSLVAQQLTDIDQNFLLAYGKVALVSKNSEFLEFVNQPWYNTKKNFFQACCICHQGVFHHRNLFIKHGLFDESFRLAGDYELLLRELKSENPYFLSDIVIAAMQMGGVSNLSENRIEALEEFRKARIVNYVSIIPLGWYWKYIKVILQFYIFQKLLGKKNTKHIVKFYKMLTRKLSTI